jgi:hypothetical protein
LKADQPSFNVKRVIFLDETAVTTKMVRQHGRAPRGERLVASVPHGHWKTLTFVAALKHDGLIAPYVIDGAMDGPTFIAYVEQVLAPTLRKGDTVFMDNLRTHKVDGVATAIEAAGAKLRQRAAVACGPPLAGYQANSAVPLGVDGSGCFYRAALPTADWQCSSRG